MTNAPGVSRKDIDDLLASGLPRHLALLFETVRDCRVALLFVHHNSGPFSAAMPRPAVPMIILIGDDTDVARGPTAFDATSLELAIKSAGAVVVISSGIVLSVYAGAAYIAAAGRLNVILIETRIEQEIPWLALVEEHAPKVPLLVCSPRGGHA